MTKFFSRELEGVATYWRIWRRDGVAMGFISHDRDMFFGGILHRAAPGVLPSAITLTSELRPDSAEVAGALTHDAIAHDDLALGLYDDAQIEVGAVDWETGVHAPLYAGELGAIEHGPHGFTAQLRSAKANLERSFVPLTSPTCRARFCGEQCGLSSRFFEHFLELDSVDMDSNVVDFSVDEPAFFLDGMVRFTEGPQTGLSFNIIGVSEEGFLLDKAIAAETKPGMKALIIEGCDHLLATCGNRFDNAANFRGEPFLPGNDLLTRYPTPK